LWEKREVSREEPRENESGKENDFANSEHEEEEGNSVSTYVEILTKIMDSVEPAISKAKSSPRKPATIEEYRALVIHEIIQTTEKYLSSLPDETAHGAVVPLREYGYRNRDDIIRRIESGIHERVEKSFGEDVQRFANFFS